MCHIIVKHKVSNLRRHMKLHGPYVECVKCLECDETFQSKNNLKTHWLRRHKNLAFANIPAKMVPTTRKAKRMLRVLIVCFDEW